MPNPKLALLQDPFTGTSINTTLWGASTAGACTLDATNDLVTVAVGTTSGTVNNLGTAGPYDATSSSLYAQIGAAPNGNGGVQTILKLATSSGNNGIQAVASSGRAFQIQVITAGSFATTSLPAYDPSAHAWWQLTENGNSTFTFSTSPDGWTWTAQATVSYSWSATSMQVYFQTGTTDTEPAGQQAWIAHVNSMLGGPYNINFPRTEEGWGPHWACNGGDSPLDRYVDVSWRTRAQTQSNRGRQYELDQVRAGEYGLTLDDTDGALDPTNSSGPFYGHIMPYQPYRKRCQWPPSRNLLTQVQATGGDLGGQPLGTINGGNNGPSIFSSTDNTGGSFVSSATAWQGGTVIQASVPTSATIPSSIVYTPQVAVQPSATYTGSLQARNVTASSSVQVYASLLWLDVNQNIISFAAGTTTTLTGSATAGWTYLTVTGTAPATAAMLYAGVRVAATPTATCSVQVDGWQLEHGPSASAWQAPGTWYPVYAGFVERWPSTWDMGGTYGQVQPTAVDAMALLSQVTLRDPLAQEIFSRNPRFLFTLGDPSGSSTAADATGNYPAAIVEVSKFGAGSLTFGNQITSTSSGGTFTGGSGTVCTIANANPGTNLQAGATYLNLALSGITGPANPSGTWTRMLAFSYTAGTPSSAAYMWDSMDSHRPTVGSQLYWYLDSNGRFTIALCGPAGTLTSFQPFTTNVADGNWHLAIAAYSHANATFTISVDGNSVTYPSFNPALEPTGLASDSLGNWIDISVGRGSAFNWQGSLAYAAEFPTALAGSDMSAIYNAWKASCAGESSDARYARILGYAGYIGVSNLQAGLTTNMGPAALAGLDALSALQAVVDTENGEHFADRAGTVTFRARSARYNALTPVYTFGENPGEIPYEDCQLDFDPTHLANLVQITQQSTGQLFTSQDATSQTDYFPRTLQRTVDAASAVECQAAAQYLCSRYKQPATRVSALVLHPAANPLLWPVCLSLELGTRVRVNRRPPGRPSISVDCFVENIQVAMTDQADATWMLQCSPVDTTPYGLFASFHTTLASAVAANASTVTINAGQDSTNPCAAWIGAGQQLVLGQNTANQETVTVKAVAATSPGWTTCVITLTANTAHSHSAGDVVCEPLPSGTTDPTTWDTVSEFGSVCFSY